MVSRVGINGGESFQERTREPPLNKPVGRLIRMLVSGWVQKIFVSLENFRHRFSCPWVSDDDGVLTDSLYGPLYLYEGSKHRLFSNHSAVKREQIIFTLETMKRRQESGIGISFIDS